jgi:hypothetical protein
LFDGMNKRTPIAFWAMCGSALALVCALALPPLLARPTNCGGNSAALAACRDIVLSFRAIALDMGDKPVSISNLSDEDRKVFRSVAGISWLHQSRVLVVRGTVTLGQEAPREIIAVCDTPFDNVPRRMFGRAPLTHAVGYSDGSAGLISVQEFHRLDLSRFIDVRTIVNPKVEPSAWSGRGVARPVCISTSVRPRRSGRAFGR